MLKALARQVAERVKLRRFEFQPKAFAVRASLVDKPSVRKRARAASRLAQKCFAVLATLF